MLKIIHKKEYLVILYKSKFIVFYIMFLLFCKNDSWAVNTGVLRFYQANSR